MSPGRPRQGTVPALVIAGTGTGVGKTTLTLGLLEALVRRGLTVQAFKVGPDFIDPGFASRVTGRPARTLDGWMCGRAAVEACVARHAADADLALIEGMMGCFDGLGGGEAGSTAEIAAWLQAPVVLVVDAGTMARSAAAVVLGFERFDPGLDLAGVVLNRVGGPAHEGALRQAIAAVAWSPVLGGLPWQADVALPERHLGLVTAGEGHYTPALGERLARLVEERLDVGALLGRARSRIARAEAGAPEPGPAPAGRPVRLGVARDRAFCFYYADNLDLLRAAGAELVFFSPLEDPALPPRLDGLYLGGGYPELHAERLAANAGLRAQVAAMARAGRPVYAECGGLMYLAACLEDAAGRTWPMAGLLPAAVSVRRSRLTLGYRRVTLAADTLLGPAGTVARGHEFHAATLEAPPAAVPRAYAVDDAGPGAAWAEGYVVGGALMSWVHLHFASNPALAAAFVAAGREGRAC
jgi:cobyrinic acid a,c-diamide synthase